MQGRYNSPEEAADAKNKGLLEKITRIEDKRKNNGGAHGGKTGRPKGEEKKALGIRVLCRLHEQLTEYVKQEEQRLIAAGK